MAMTFLTTDDFLLKLPEDIRNQITGGDDTIIDEAESQATAIIQDAFFEKYDLGAEFAKTGTDRHVNLLRWVLNLTIYFIYERIPANQVPERIVKNYDDTIVEIKNVEAGKRNTTLAKLIREDNLRKETNFRWGAEKPRKHNPY
jgi:hypothetical protein